jgi:hypothetical protein
MKNLNVILLFCVVCSCTNKTDESIINLLAKNNKFYSIQLEEYKIELQQSRVDSPRMFDEKYFEAISENFDAIQKLQNKSGYDTIFEKIRELAIENKIGKIIKPIVSEHKEVLKNNLYVNLMQAIHAYKLNKPIGLSTHCRMGDRFKISKTIAKDSVTLDFYTSNPYQLNIDYIIDEKDTIYNSICESNKAYKVWSIRYKPKSKNSSCQGKIFFNEFYSNNAIFVQEFDDKKVVNLKYLFN